MGDRVFDDDRPTVDLGPGVLAKATGDELTTDDLGPGDDGDDTRGDENPFEPMASTPGRLSRLTPAEPGTMKTPPVDPVHHLPTQQLSSPQTGSKRGRPATGGSVSRAFDSKTGSSSPVEALRHDEVERSRVFLKVALFLSLSGAIAAYITPGDPIAKQVVAIGSVLGAIGSIWLLLRLRDSTNYGAGIWLSPGLLLIAGAFTGLYYWGMASPVSGMLVYGIYFFSLGSSRSMTIAMYAIVAIGHLLLGLAIILGVIADRGIINVSSLRHLEQVAILVIIEALYFLAYITARISQRVTLDAMQKLETAARQMAQRDALLAEARAELDRALKIGGPGRFTEQVVGSFRLGVLIGRGGMGEVYEAHGTTDQREAAVKLLHPGTLADPTSVARFIREAQTASKLDTPYVVRVLEVGTTTGEIPFLAMERLRGHDLAHQLRRQRRLQPNQAAVVVEHVAQGLEAARLAGIVHRDLKPHNVFMAEQGKQRTWKILDFGVSKSGGSGTLTKGHVVGTPAYMAPEQARGEDVDHRADVYSLAAILYRSVTGHPAFTGKDVPTTLYDVVFRVPTQPSMLAPLPADIDRVLAIGLAKNIADRFDNALQLSQWFAHAIESKLSPEQRERADELIARQPWGTRSAAIGAAGVTAPAK
ncbi:MAG: serine/threonine-protein kinase [Kofleriaceae bacterium]